MYQYYVISRVVGCSQHSMMHNHPFTGLLLLRRDLLYMKVVQAGYAQLSEYKVITY